MRLFRFKNKASNCWWVISPTVELAKELSVISGHVRKSKNATLLKDETDERLKESAGDSLKSLLEGEDAGLAIKRMGAQSTWIMSPRFKWNLSKLGIVAKII